MVTMGAVDEMMRRAEQDQNRAQEELRAAESFPITGVQLNASSRLVTIYQRQTGEPRTMPALAAEIALRKRYKDPSSPLYKEYIFSAKPTKQYYSGTNKCMLHPADANRALYDRWGLPVCESAKLASPGEVIRHMELRHPSAYKIIKREEDETKRKTERESQAVLASAMLEAIKSLGANATAPAIVEKAMEDARITAGEAGTQRRMYVQACPKCGQEFKKASMGAAKSAVTYHARKCTGPATP